MSKSNANSSRFLLPCSLIFASPLGACSGLDWEDQRLVIDVLRQSPDHSHDTTTENPDDTPDDDTATEPCEAETEHDAGAALAPLPGFELCETSLLGQAYANNGSFWIGEVLNKHYRVDGGGFWSALEADSGEVRYSKEVDLRVAADGTLTDTSGRIVLGYSRGVEGEKQCPSALRAPISCVQQPTTRVSHTMNLDPDMAISGASAAQPWLAASLSASILVYDSTGMSHWLNVHVNKLDDFAFSYHVTVEGGELDGGTPGTEQVLGGGTLSFDTNGALLDAQTPDISVDFDSATPGQPIAVDFGEDIVNDGSDGLGGSTSFAGNTHVAFTEQDGHSSGTAVDVWIGARGVVTVECSYGGNFEIGSVVLARFPDENALRVAPDGSFRKTSESGAPAFAPPGYPGRGYVE